MTCNATAVQGFFRLFAHKNRSTIAMNTKKICKLITKTRRLVTVKVEVFLQANAAVHIKNIRIYLYPLWVVARGPLMSMLVYFCLSGLKSTYHVAADSTLSTCLVNTTRPRTGGKCVRFGAGRSGVWLWVGSYRGIVTWYCSLLTKRMVYGRAAGTFRSMANSYKCTQSSKVTARKWNYSTN